MQLDNAERGVDAQGPVSRSTGRDATSRDRSPAERILILESGRTERNYWRDLWHYRELFAILAWRDVSVRYKQTVIGVAWALIRPFLTMVVFTVVFGRLAKLPSDGVGALSDDGVRRHAAVVPVLEHPVRRLRQPRRQRQPDLESLFPAPRHSRGLGGGRAGRFPRQPRDARRADGCGTASCRAGGSCCCRSSSLLAVLASLGPALWITALNVKYRDFRYIIPFIVQFGLYVSPVGFSSSVIPDEWRLLVQPQSGGRRDRRLPLVPAGRRQPALPAGLPGEPRRRRLLPVVRRALFPRDRAHLRGHGLS